MTKTPARPCVFSIFSQEFQRSLLVPCLGDEALEHLAFVIDCPLKVVPLAIDLYEYFVEMPTPVARAHAFDPAPSDLRSKHRAEAVPPKPDGLVADLHATFVEQVFHVAEREWELVVHHYR